MQYTNMCIYQKYKVFTHSIHLFPATLNIRILEGNGYFMVLCGCFWSKLGLSIRKVPDPWVMIYFFQYIWRLIDCTFTNVLFYLQYFCIFNST